MAPNHYHDLARVARERPAFVQRLNALTEQFKKDADTDKLIHETLKACDYNMGFMLPFFFPNFAGPNEPLSLSRRPFAFPMYAMLLYGSLTIKGSRQISKCRVVGSDEPVTGANGAPLYPEDLQVGATVVGVNPQAWEQDINTVVTKHDCGTLPCTKVYTRSGAVLHLSDEHKLLTCGGWVEVNKLKPGMFIATVERAGAFTGRSNPGQDRVRLVAMLLGDGCTVNRSVSFTAKNKILQAEFHRICGPRQERPVRDYRKKGTLARMLCCNRDGQVLQWVTEDGMLGKYAWEKVIPPWVFDLSKQDTVDFINFLWATDGMVKPAPTMMQISYSSTSKRLAEGVRALLCKFGIPTSISTYHAGYRCKKSKAIISCKPTHIVRVETREGWQTFIDTFQPPGKTSRKLPRRLMVKASNNNKDVIPSGFRHLFKQVISESRLAGGKVSLKQLTKVHGVNVRNSGGITRAKAAFFLKYVASHGVKGEAWRRLHNILHNGVAWTTVKKITKTGNHPAWDIEVSGSHSYVLSGVVSHNSSNLSARQLCLTNLLPRYQSTYIAPHTEHTRTYALKLEEMTRAFRYPVGGKGLRNNLMRKEMADTGGVIEIYRVLTSAGHMRGKTADELDYDEYQLFDSKLEAETRQLQRTSKRPTTIYSGTSTTLDSPLEVRFGQSSGGVWHMRSPNGKLVIDCSDPEQFLKMIRPQGLTCPVTERLITNPLDGEWVHARPSAYLEHNRLGIHIPQIIIPEFMARDEWQKIYQYYKDFGDQRTLQEVGGISVENGLREITEHDLISMCSLPFDNSIKIQEWAMQRSRYRMVVSGCDWGGSDWQMARTAKTSYTVHVVLGINSDGTFDILHMRRHGGMDYDDIGKKIVADHVRLGGTAIGSDFGAGIQYNTYLHRHPNIHPNSHWIFQYGPPTMAMLKKPQHPMHGTHLLLNKTESITGIFMAIKRLRLRCYNWEDAKGLLTDCLNCFRVHSETQLTGRQYFVHISNPSRPCDTLHALNYAYTLGRMLLREPLIDDPALREFVHGHFSQMVSAIPGGHRRGDLGVSG